MLTRRGTRTQIRVVTRIITVTGIRTLLRIRIMMKMRWTLVVSLSILAAVFSAGG